MESLMPEILRQGIVAGLLFWLFMNERSDRKQAQKENIALMEARRADAKDTVDKIEQPLKSIAQSQQFIADKLTNGNPRS